MESRQASTLRVLLVYSSAGSASRLVAVGSLLGAEGTRLCSLADAPRVAGAEPAHPVILVDGVSDRFSGLAPDVLDSIAAVHRSSGFSQIVLLLPSSLDIDTCCRAIEAGVSGFVEVADSQVDADLLLRRLDEADQRYTRLLDSSQEHLHHRANETDVVPMVSQSRRMSEVIAKAARAAQISDAPVLIHGESGTGKQLLAEMVHRLDPKRCNRPFLTVNCAAITGTLAESSLFGHVRGAFTGATQTRAGYFKAAEGGILFLDEIGELDAVIQPKLLRVLQNGMILPVGSDVEVPVDVRILAATNRTLPDLINQGKFRLDLYQRLNVLSLDIPPLRERPEDVEALVPYFVKKYAHAYGQRIEKIDRRVYEFLSQCTMTGNVRELENAIRRILAMKTGGEELLLTDIPESLRRERHTGHETMVTSEMVAHACRMIEKGEITLPQFISECERQLLASAISQSDQPAAHLAERLGMSRRTLYNKRRKYGL